MFERLGPLDGHQFLNHCLHTGDHSGVDGCRLARDVGYVVAGTVDYR